MKAPYTRPTLTALPKPPFWVDLVTGWRLTITRWSVLINIANTLWSGVWGILYTFNRMSEALVMPVICVAIALMVLSTLAANLTQKNIRTVRVKDAA